MEEQIHGEEKYLTEIKELKNAHISEGTIPIPKRIKSAPSRLGKYINDMAQMILKNLLATF